MIRETKQLKHCYIHARDGDVGNLQDLYFDDEHWHIRYFVVDAGKWLARRSVLIAPTAVSTADWSKRVLEVNLSKEQVRNSPPVDTQQPVSRQQEATLHDYYGWPYYWSGAALGTGYVAPIAPLTAPSAAALRGSCPLPPRDPSQAPPKTVEVDMRQAAEPKSDSHLRSARVVRGYHIAATDGPMGHVEDIVVDDTTWEIPFLLVDTRKWWMGKTVMITPEHVRSVSWERSTVYLDVPRDAVRSAPEFYRTKASAADYTDKLESHFGWLRRARRDEPANAGRADGGSEV